MPSQQLVRPPQEHAALPSARPEELGFSAQRLAAVGEALDREVAQDRMPGAVIAIARHGKLAMFEAHGYRDKATGAPMTADAIFNIASMTKPVTAVAALILCEQGRLSIDDPVGKFLPQFANPRVAVMDPAGQTIIELVPAERPVTVQDLMRHTCGMVYGSRGSTAVHKMYPEGSHTAAAQMTGCEFLDRLAELPLLHQPGSVWDYGFGLDVLGLIIETIAQQSLGEFLRRRVCEPLGMDDIGFFIPLEKASRYARALPSDPVTGRPQALQALTQKMKFECGGGGAASTVGDYLRFALMLLNKGSFAGTRILGRKTIDYMLSNQLGPGVKNLIASADPTRADYGFGLGLAVRTTPGIVRLFGSVGDFNWPGMSGTNWWADPQEQLAVVFMAHTPGPIRWHYRQLINALVYQALVD